MGEFRSWQDYWRFEHAVKRETRYSRDTAGGEFLETVLATAEKRIEVLPLGGYVWRAQLGCDSKPLPEGPEYVDSPDRPYPPTRMKPTLDSAREGRANPQGILCLYVATNKETAMAEVRPWKGSRISLGRFKLRRSLRIVNCTVHGKGSVVYAKEPSPEEREDAVWSRIDEAFAMPATRADHLAEYAPTQTIAELFKVHGFDGIAYASSLGPGHNMALFRLDVADLAGCFLFELKDLDFGFQEAGPHYSLRQQDGPP